MIINRFLNPLLIIFFTFVVTLYEVNGEFKRKFFIFATNHFFKVDIVIWQVNKKLNSLSFLRRTKKAICI